LFSVSLDVEVIASPDTYGLACQQDKPWYLRTALEHLWITAWKRIPAGTFPDDDEIIASCISAPIDFFMEHKAILLRGWVKHSDGLLYHNTITKRVLHMIEKRAAARSASPSIGARRHKPATALRVCGNARKVPPVTLM